MLYEITGTIKVIENTQTFASGFSKRSFVITTDEERFPQPISMSALKDRCALLDNFKLGERVKVSFVINGREWTDPQGKVKYFVDLVALKIESLDAVAPTEAAAPVTSPAMSAESLSEDDMPF